MPRATSADQLRRENEQLGAELIQARAALREMRAAYEKSAIEHTAELERVTAALATETQRREQVEHALAAAEQTAGDLIRYAPTAIYEADFRTRRFTRVNDAMCRMSGYTRDELLAMNPFDLLDEESAQRLAARTRAALAGESIQGSVEYKVKTKDGREIYAILESRPVYADGRATGAFVIAHDVTERKRAEETLRDTVHALRTSERQFQEIIDGLPGLVFVKDLEYRFVTINRTLEQLLGMTRAELAGKTDYDIFPRAAADDYREHDQRVLESGFEQFEEEADLADGHHVFLANKFVLRDPEGRSYALGAISLDITDRKRSEGILQAQRQLLETVVNHMPAAVNLIRGRDLKLQLINPMYQAIAPGKEMVGKTLDDVWPETGRDLGALCRQVLATGEPYLASDELFDICRTPGGPVEQAFFSWSLHRVRLPGDEGWGILNTAWETTERKRAEEALRSSEEKYRTLFESMDEGYCVIEVLFDESDKPIDYLFLETNPAFEKQTGIHNAIGRRMRSIAPEHEEYWFQVYGRVARTGEPVRIQGRAAAQNRWYDAYAFRIGRLGENTLAVLFTDITVRKMAEDALARSNEKFSQVLDSIQDDFYVLDRDWKFVYASRRFTSRIGKEPADFVGNCIWDMFPNHVGSVLDENFRATMEKREVRRFEVAGRYTEAWYHMTSFPSTEGITVLGIDISARKQAEQAVEAAHRRTVEILESIQDGFFALDRDWRFTYVNSRAAANIGSTSQALIGRNFWEKFPELAGTAHETHYRKAMAEGVPVHYELEGVLTRGAYDIRVYPSADGISVYWIDITQRKQREAQIRTLNRELERQKLELLNANKELESFSYSVSHDLRAPLGSIDGFTSMILKDYGAQLPPETVDLLHLVEQNAQQMSRLIEALLLLSRTSRQALTRQPVAPRDIAEDVLKMLQPQFQGRQVEIILQDLPTCQADPVLLRQVYANLLSNALKFTRNRATARIEIGSRIGNGETVYFVKDNGVGFDMEQAGKLFGLFQRLHGEDEYEGTGIGLAIVQRIVRRHGGRVWAEGEEEQGATFYFTLDRTTS